VFQKMIPSKRSGMIYLIAVILGLVACVQSWAGETTEQNLIHVRNGRPPNAGFLLVPAIPIYPMLAIGVAWVLDWLTPQFAIWILVGGFLLITLGWAIAYVKLKADLSRANSLPRRMSTPSEIWKPRS